MAFSFSSKKKGKVRQDPLRGNSETPVRGLDDNYLSTSIFHPEEPQTRANSQSTVRSEMGERFAQLNHGVSIEDGPEDKKLESLLDLKLRNLRMNSKAILAGRKPRTNQIAKQVTAIFSSIISIAR